MAIFHGTSFYNVLKTTKEIIEMHKKSDANGDGKVSKDEFVKFMSES